MKIRFLSLMVTVSVAFLTTPASAEGDACESGGASYASCLADVPMSTHCEDYYDTSYCWIEPDYQRIQDCWDRFYEIYAECQRILQQYQEQQQQQQQQQQQNQPPPLPTPDPYPNGNGPTPSYPEDYECPPDDTMPGPSGGPQIACHSSSSSSSSSGSGYSSSTSHSSSSGYSTSSS